MVLVVVVPLTESFYKSMLALEALEDSRYERVVSSARAVGSWVNGEYHVYSPEWDRLTPGGAKVVVRGLVKHFRRVIRGSKPGRDFDLRVIYDE